nr:hypothetical protein 32 [bacterium]
MHTTILKEALPWLMVGALAGSLTGCATAEGLMTDAKRIGSALGQAVFTQETIEVKSVEDMREEKALAQKQ